MGLKEFQFKSCDGLTLHAGHWEMKSPEAVICMVHGMGEHSGRYAHVARFFNEQRYAVLLYDQRGHGKSEGKRGHAPSYEFLMDDVSRLLEQARLLYPRIPVFLYGHSMGGNLVLNYALRKKPAVSGVISSSPWLRLAFEPPAIKVLLAKWVNGIYPSLTQPSGLDATAISRDAEVVNAYKKDPLVHDKISSNMFLCAYNAGLWALEHASEFPLPLLLYHGTKDRLTSFQASGEFAKKNSEKITFKPWEGFYHESHNEPEKEEVFQLIVGWIKKNLPK